MGAQPSAARTPAGVVLTHGAYWRSLLNTVGYVMGATLAALVVAVPMARFLAMHRQFPGRGVLVGTGVPPFPGVVVGFLVILLAGRQGVVASVSQALAGERWMFAYGMAGLFLGYLYFSLPRAIGVLTATAEKISPAILEAAPTLGARPWRRFVDIELPAHRLGRSRRHVVRPQHGGVRRNCRARRSTCFP